MKKVKFITKNTLTGEEGTRMTITNDGKIGIGTETPGKVLDVSGDINFTGTLFQNGEAFTSGADLATSSISELADVNLTGIATNQGLKWDGTKLVPTSLSTGGEGGGGFTDLTTFSISDLSNVNLSGISAGQGVQWDGTKLVPANATTKMGSIVPLAHNTYSLGTPTNVWKDVYIGPGSLYIDGQKVIESDSNTIIMGADDNQNLKINGTGTGQIQIETESNNISIQTIGSGDVVLGSTGSGTVKITKNISLLDGVEIQNIGGTHVTVNDNLNVTGTILTDNITERTSAHGVIVGGVTLKNGSVTAGSNSTISASNFNVGSKNVVSASAQGSFTDLEVKNLGNTGFLVFGETGDAQLTGTLQVDDIGEKTSAHGVVVGGVTLKNGSVTAGSNSTISASNFNVGSKNVVSASAQGSFTDLEVKNLGNTGFLVTGETGDAQLTGTLQVDDIGEKTSAHGVVIDGVTIKDGDISANSLTINGVPVTGGGGGGGSGTTATSITKQGQVLETLAGVCDGRSITVESGTYTLENVTTKLPATTTFADVTGSKINYKPPVGVKTVIYDFEFQHNYDGLNGWGYYKFLLDGTQVGEVFEIGFDQYGSGMFKVSFPFEIGVNDLANGKILTWDTNKEIKIQFREHSSSNSQIEVHVANNWKGISSGSGLIKPRIKIQSIGESSGQAVNLNNSSISDLSNVSITAPSDGQALVWNDASGVWKPGNVAASGGSTTTVTKQGQALEILSGVCDGRTVEVESGTYTLENVTTSFNTSSSSWTKITGSGISYKPPSGARQVIFKFYYAFRGPDSSSFSPLFFTKLKVGNSYVEGQEYSWRTLNNGYPERVVNNTFVLDINSEWTESITDGKLSSWNTNRNLQIDIRSWSGMDVKIHALRHEDGVSESQTAGYFRAPRIQIIAIGEETTTSGGGGGTTIDSTTDISVNHLDVSSNLTVDGRIAVGKDLLSLLDGYQIDITFHSHRSYNNWVIFNTSNDNGGWIPQGSDFTIEYEHKITKGTYANYVHFSIIFGRDNDDAITADTFAPQTYFMYNQPWNLSASLQLRYSPYNGTNVEANISNFNLTNFTSDYVKVKWIYIYETATVSLYLNDTYAQSHANQTTDRDNVYGRWGFAEWNYMNTHNIRNPRITINNSTHTLTSVHSTSNEVPTTGFSTIYRSFLPTLDVSGNGTFSGSVTANGTVLSSDDRIKHNETVPATPLNTIMKMTPKHYFKTRTMYDVSHNFTVDASGYPVDFSNNRLVEGKDYTRETGIIAQDLQSIPELNYIVKNNGPNEPLGVDYNSIHCTHIAATKELHAMVKSQQTIIDDHVKKINALTGLYAVQKQKTENLENALAAIKQHLGI